MKKALTTIIFVIFAGLSAGGVAGQDMTDPLKAGISEYRAGNYDKAVNIMEKISQADPQNYRARYYLAIALVRLKRIKEAKNHYIDIITYADEPELVDFSLKGLKLLDPKTFEKVNKSRNNIVNTVQQRNTTVIDTTVPQNKAILTPEQQQKINQVAAANNVSHDELNNLINLLANNPGALKTINKLASSNASNAGNQDGYDPESIAKMIKLFTMNSQFDMLNFDKKDDQQNNNSSFDIMGLMAGQNGMNSMNTPSGNMNKLMEYLNNPTNKGNINPEMINMLFKQNMFSDFSSGGF